MAKTAASKSRSRSAKRPETHLQELEITLLLAILHLKDAAYGSSIRRRILEVADRKVSRGAIYVTLERLTEKGYLRSTMGDPTPVRGGRAKRFFHLEPPGLEALKLSLGRLKRLQEGLDPLLEER